MLSLTTLAACTSGDDPAGPEPSATYSFAETVAADEICDGSIAGEAARDLEGLAGGTEFSEAEGFPPADLGAYAAEMTESDAFSGVFCSIYTPTYWSDSFIDIRFYWFGREAADIQPQVGAVLYGAGELAFVEDDAAYIKFACAVRDTGEETDLYATLTMPSTETAIDPDAMMAVLNSVSSALAGELGCPDAGLTATPPERLPDA
ncbi:hypothetical protein ACL02R_08630 [Streptomyces sp. MS19]|uniref:hypothetical protein n=1 Tax=Streptomyces sp. MS19 TaxID=3385972 RepID=UPI0039A358B8